MRKTPHKKNSGITIFLQNSRSFRNNDEHLERYRRRRIEQSRHSKPFLHNCKNKNPSEHVFKNTTKTNTDSNLNSASCQTFTNIGAKVLGARLAKFLDLLTTTLTTCLCNSREHVAESGEIRQRTTIRYQRSFRVTKLNKQNLA